MLYSKIHSRFQHIEIMGLFNSLSEHNSCMDEKNFAHLETTIQPPTNKLVPCNPSQDNCFQESVLPASSGQSNGEEDCEDSNDPVTSSGLQHITFKQAHGAASQTFLDHLFASGNHENWSGIIDAAYSLRGDLGISQSAWIEACSLLGRSGAAICVLITDQHSRRKVDPVRRPGGYFRGMIAKGREGELRLHASIFGILNRTDSPHEADS